MRMLQKRGNSKKKPEWVKSDSHKVSISLKNVVTKTKKGIESVNNSEIIKDLTDNCKFVLKFAHYKETEQKIR